MDAWQTRVRLRREPGARENDDARATDVRRVGTTALPHAAQLALLNADAVGEALRFKPDVTLSMHLVVSPAAAAIRRVLGVPVVQYFHAEEIGAWPRLAAFAAIHADVAIAVSCYTASLVRSTGAAGADIRIIPNGVDLPSDPNAQKGRAPHLSDDLADPGALQAATRPVRALALVRARCPRCNGWSSAMAACVARSKRSRGPDGVADSVRFLGSVSDQQRNAWLRRTQLMAMPSRLPAGGFAGEGFGIAYLEAGVYGKPVVAGNVGGVLDAVLDGVTGLLVDPLDQLAVAEAITRLLVDPELACRPESPAGCVRRNTPGRRSLRVCRPALFVLLSSAYGSRTVGPGRRRAGVRVLNVDRRR